MQSLKYVLATGLGILLGLTTSAHAQGHVPWVSSVEKARNVASQQHRLVLLHFWSEECGPCQHLERSVFNQPQVIRSLDSGYIPVKVNVQDNRELARKYAVRAIPTDVIIRPDGSELYRSVSPKEADRYTAFLDEIVAHWRLGRVPPKSAVPQGDIAQATAIEDNFGQQQTNPYVQPTLPPPSSDSFQSGNDAKVPAVYQGNRYSGNRYTDPASAGGALDSYPAPSTPSNNSPGVSPPSAPAASGQRQLYGTPPHSETATGDDRGTFMPPGTRGSGYGPAASPSAVQRNPYDTQQQPTSPSGNADSAYAPPSAAHPSGGRSPGGSAPSPSPTADPTGIPRSEPAAPQAAAVGLDGYCPVTLVRDRKWQRGDSQWGAIHRGRTYLFTGAEEQRQFLADPDRYSPALSGYDPVKFAEQGQLLEGRRQHGVFCYNQIYLFADEQSLARFWMSPEGYVATVRQAMRQSDGPSQSR